MNRNREVEAALAVCAEEPMGVVRRILGLREAGLPLEPRSERRFRDVYLDTAERALRERGLALRIRREGDAEQVTLKGEGRALPGGGVERLEVEASATGRGLEELWEAAAREGVELPGEPRGRPSGPPGSEAGAATGFAAPSAAGEVLRGMGFRVVQERRTLRRRRAVLRPDAAGEAGELAVDRVEFRLPGGTVLHREVEVEGLGPDAGRVVERVAGALRDRFPGALRPWDHSKLATGEALEALADETGLEALARADGSLRLRAYDALEERLGRRGPPS